MRTLLLLLGLTLTHIAPTAAQSERPVDPATLSLARMSMEKMGMTSMLRLSLRAQALTIRQAIERANPGRAEAVADVMAILLEEFDHRLPFLTEAFAIIYAQHFTVDELTEISRFYDSQTGQKLVRETGSIMKEAQEVVTRLGFQFEEEIIQRLAPELQKRNL